ncbi:MAG: hypothetical protein LBS45_00370 [Synergistaceae bacterium]|jgi:hypothetical protein|nr:hypothetical protein [Synergistaceae bacterium]
MPDILSGFSEIGRKLSRLFLGRIVVRSLGDIHRTEPVRIMTHFHAVGINPMRAETMVRRALFVKWKSTKAVSSGSLLGGKILKHFKVRSVRLPVLHRKNIRGCGFNIKERAVARRAMRRIGRTPITRRNRVHFVKSLPKFERASVLALFSPIFGEKVVKSTLDKGSGNLLFWYDNDRPKTGERNHLLLLRVFGEEEPLKWVWLPVNKKK